MKQDHWRQHEPILLAFESAWQKPSPPNLHDFAQQDAIDDPTALLAELVMIDFEHRWRRDAISNLDSYFTEFPELREDRLVRDELLRHEFLLRKSAGKPPHGEELLQRFGGDSSVADLCAGVDSELVPSLDQRLNPGTLVGTYRIVRKIGQGAFASVYLAIDTRLQREVALKFLVGNDIRSSSRIRLRREAQAVAALKHPNIVPVFEAGNFRGHDYVATRYIQGTTLDQQLSKTKLPIKQAVQIVIQLCSALGHAHAAGVVHRDIKPANVMLDEGLPLLLDFGLAQLRDSSQQLTHEGDLVGTPAYMPPEQADGRGWQADPRSDIYSLGALLYRTLFHRLPFEGTTAEVISQIIHREPNVPRNANSHVDRDLQTIVLKCLQKDPAHRYQTAAAFADDLQRYVDGKPIRARPIGWTGRLIKWSRRRPAIALLLLGVMTLLAFSGGIATQLRKVTNERDRAQEARTESQELLAKSAVDAGRLAMQRGKLVPAIDHFQQALERGYPDRVGILLSLVDAHFIQRDLDAAADLLRQAIDADDKRHEPEITMWRGELALEGLAEFGEAATLFAQAKSMPMLADADRHYAQGMLSETSIDAVQAFRSATDIDPFHYRSRRMLILLLFSLARVEETNLQVRIARQLYPDDQDFELMFCMNTSMQGNLDDAYASIDRLPLKESSKLKWRDLCRELHEISHQGRIDRKANEDLVDWLHRLIQKMQRKFIPLAIERNWRFPPRIQNHVVDFSADLPDLASSKSSVGIESLESLADVHPEASLLLTLGSLRLNHVSADVVDRKKEIKLLELARRDFERSLRYPGFLKQSRQQSWVSIFTTSMTLALIHRHRVDENTKRYSEALRNIELGSVSTHNQLRALTIAAITCGNLDEADRWVERWSQIETTDKNRQVDVLWHQTIILKRHGDWLAVKSKCERVLQLAPQHPFAPGLLKEATDNVRKLLDAPPVAPSGTPPNKAKNDPMQLF